MIDTTIVTVGAGAVFVLALLAYTTAAITLRSSQRAETRLGRLISEIAATTSAAPDRIAADDSASPPTEVPKREMSV